MSDHICLKLADVTPLYKLGKKDHEENYSISVSMCGFRKGLSTHQYLLALLEKWKREIDNGEIFGDLLTDLSKAFDCLDHELSIAKLNGYGFSLPVLRSIQDYPNRKQITKINFSFSE